MSCIICGKDEQVNDQGFCATCAAKLAGLSDSSSILRKMSEDLKRAESRAPSPQPEETASETTDSSILLRFGQTKECTLVYPFSVAIDPNQQILVLDQPAREEYRITIYDPEGQYAGEFLRCRKGEGPTELKYPKGIAIDQHGNLYVPDAGNHRIQRFDARGQCLGSVGRLGQAPGEFDSPCDIEIDEAGCLFVADTYNDRIQKLTPKGVPLLTIGDDANLNGPLGVTVDEKGRIYVADTNHHRVTIYDDQGRQVRVFGREGTGPGEMTFPSDVRVGQDGTIYIADQDNLRIQRFSPEGVARAEFSLSAIMKTGRTPEGDVAVDDDGYLFICDKYANSVVKAELHESNPS